jgi:ABC-type lipoprotein export system ATPase subunit
VNNDNDKVVAAINPGDLITVNRLSKHFRSGGGVVKAVDDITLNLPRGKMIAIKGSSGSGKSTLLNLLGALDKATGGVITVDGVNVTELSGNEEVMYRRRKVGFIFQSYALVPNLTAIENVKLPMELNGDNSEQQAKKAIALLERVKIDSAKLFRKPSRLSGGEQQRVAIARALANDPPLILADEPTGNLDSKTGQRIIELLHGLSKEGKTIIIVTHDTAVANKADTVIEMEDGKVV